MLSGIKQYIIASKYLNSLILVYIFDRIHESKLGENVMSTNYIFTYMTTSPCYMQQLSKPNQENENELNSWQEKNLNKYA